MSLILEALRKSEAERRRGLPPDLRAELPPAPAPRRPAAAVWWAGAAVLVLAVAAWWALRGSAPPPGSSTPEPQAGTSARPPAETASAPAGPLLPARTPADRQAARHESDDAPGRPESTSLPRPAPDSGSAGDAPAAAVAAAAPAPAAAAQAPTPSSAQAAQAARTPATDGGRALTLAELEPGTRAALPPLKLSMHLWDADPARRFVILDGHRLGEGDRVGEGSIVRIERDGVLLEFRGRGIRVPVR